MPLNNPAHDFSTAQQGYSSMDAPYGNQAFSSSGWLEKEEAKKRRSKWLVSPSPFTRLPPTDAHLAGLSTPHPHPHPRSSAVSLV